MSIGLDVGFDIWNMFFDIGWTIRSHYSALHKLPINTR